jgi:hypothetical protein
MRAIRSAHIRRAYNATTESCSASRRHLTISAVRCQSNASTTFVRRAAPTSATPAQPVRPAVSTAQPTKPVGTSTTAQPSPGPFTIRKAPTPPVQTERNTLANPPQEPILDLSQSGLSDQPPVLGKGSEENVDWTTSFSGLSQQAFSKEAADILLQPIEVDDIEIKADGILYLPEIKYRRILNRAFGPGGWGLAPRGETIVTAKCVTREYALVANGRCVVCVSLEGLEVERLTLCYRLVSIARGEQDYFDNDGIPTATEGCKSNALMRCCKDLGVASELWDPRFIRRYMAQNTKELWVEHVISKKKKKVVIRKDDEVKYPFKESKAGY